MPGVTGVRWYIAIPLALLCWVPIIIGAYWLTR